MQADAAGLRSPQAADTIGTSVSSQAAAAATAAATAADAELDAVGSDDSQHPHLLPKVQVPFITKPGETPRRVQIQR